MWGVRERIISRIGVKSTECIIVPLTDLGENWKKRIWVDNKCVVDILNLKCQLENQASKHSRQ